MLVTTAPCPRRRSYAALALLGVLAWVLWGCASSTLRDPRTGKVIARFESNIASGTYSSNGTTFAFVGMDNSTPTTAAYGGASRLAGTVGGLVVAGITAGSTSTPTVAKLLVPATASVAPHVYTKPVATPAPTSAAQAEKLWPIPKQ